MSWPYLLGKRRKKISVSFEQHEICHCSHSATLHYDSLTASYTHSGLCNKDLICASISVDKHKA
ncbi:MAG: hypothetical protein ACXAB4_01605, partial [Candidatus Hodarchaeales archaeon]